MSSKHLAFFLVGAGAFFIQCSGTEEPNTNLPEVIYGGTASDEAFERVWPKIATAQLSDASAARISAPMNGTTIPNTAAPTFSFNVPNAMRETNSEVRFAAASAKKSILYFGSAIAEAHLPPVTGEVYLLELAIPGQQTPLRVFTTETSWTADPDSWTKIKNASGSISIKIYNAYVNANVLTEGPFTREETVAFTVGTQ